MHGGILGESPALLVALGITTFCVGQKEEEQYVATIQASADNLVTLLLDLTGFQTRQKSFLKSDQWQIE